MNRVRSKRQVVGMRSRRPKNKLRVVLGMELDWLVRGLEDDELTCGHSLGGQDTSSSNRGPADRVICGRLVAPGFADPEPYG